MTENGSRLSIAGSYLGKLFPRSLPPRLLLIFFAIIIQIGGEVLSWYAKNTGNPIVISFAVILWLSWFGLVFLIAKPSIDDTLRPYRKILHLAAVVIVVILSLMAIGEGIGVHLVNTGVVKDNAMATTLTEGFTYNDATALNQQASQTLLKGENPYAKSNIISAAEEFKVPTSYLTPLKEGAFAQVFPYPTEQQMDEALSKAETSTNTPPVEFESKVSYPAGSFLFQAPFVALGLKDTRWFYLLCAVVMVAVIFWKAPQRLRPLVVIAFITNLVLWNLIGTGQTDTLYLLFILLGWIFRKQLLLSALFMGIAATTKQIAWLFILFYLILILREVGWKRAVQSFGVIAVTFIVTNLPFIFSAPQAWMQGVLAPILDPMFPKGAGLVAFSIAGILPPNSLLFTLMEVGVLIVAIVWYYFNCRKYPQAGLLLAVLPLFFAWRSFSAYFYFASLLVFGAVIIEEYRRSAAGKQPQLVSSAHA
jgi:uncharacterized membrane protein